MTAEAILLSVRHPSGGGSYRFLCPSCQDPVVKRADHKIVALLVSAGVDVADSGSGWGEGSDSPSSSPEQHWESLPGRHAPFTRDDVLEFHLLLQDDEWLARELPSS